MATITKIVVRGYRQALTPVSDITISVYTTDATRTPTGAAIGSATVSSGSFAINTPTTVEISCSVDIGSGNANGHTFQMTFPVADTPQKGMIFGALSTDWDELDESVLKYHPDSGWSYGSNFAVYEVWLDSVKTYYSTLSFDIGYWSLGGTGSGLDTSAGVWFNTSDLYVFDPPVPTGLNNMKTLRRLAAAANNRIWYEDI